MADEDDRERTRSRRLNRKGCREVHRVGATNFLPLYDFRGQRYAPAGLHGDHAGPMQQVSLYERYGSPE